MAELLNGKKKAKIIVPEGVITGVERLKKNIERMMQQVNDAGKNAIVFSCS